ncbi:MAG: EamA family transporter [Acidobacteria bacterium]|nr:MAG: EamA family transporter [Acidobacteriota bacterium]PYY07637.1 MAG: EamA family transporter [Acidobacteriota bacterium]
MTGSPQLLSTGFALASAACWGASDFSGGYASKRSDAFLVTMLAHASGFLLMTALAVVAGAPFPNRSGELWALAAGALGGTALAVFYRTLATGSMGITAPLAAVLAAGIPTAFAIITEGIPGTLPITGFVLAVAGIWLMSRPDAVVGRPEGLFWAVLAGFGFAGFFICINQTADNSAVWSAAHSRLASLTLVGAIVLAQRGPKTLHFTDATVAIFAGCLDSTGTLLFIRADQTGRLDAAVVLSSLYPAITVLLARLILKEHFTRWKALGILAALAAVPMIALQ